MGEGGAEGEGWERGKGPYDGKRERGLLLGSEMVPWLVKNEVDITPVTTLWV